MSYLKVKNPETVDVRTVFKGQEYTVAAGETKSYPADAVDFLLEVYGFLVSVPEETEKEVIAKVVKSKVETVTEEDTKKVKK